MFRSCHLDYLADGRGKFKISDQPDVPGDSCFIQKDRL